MSAPPPETPEASESNRVLRSSAVMAAGTVVSRLSGFVRTALLVLVLGNLLHADLFNLANTVPNMLYILLAGGIFNAVLVPQLVRSMKLDADGGDAYANRIITLAALFLGTVTILLVAAAPWVMDVFLNPTYDDPSLAAQRESIVMFARFCLPQVFFYGMFVLVGQVLNARGRFGPMMWAPIANNLVAIAVLLTYWLSFGALREADNCAAFTTGQELLLGLGSTAGIVVQFLILVPYLRATGFRYRPQFDFRGTGLGHTLRLGMWTVLFVVANQIAYTVVVRLASGGTAANALECRSATQGTGYTIYSNAFLIMMVPHSIVTVSLATAVLPTLAARAADGDLTRLASTVARTLRQALAVVVPFAVLLPVIAPYVANTLFGLGGGRSSYELYVPTLSLFAAGLVLFTVHYLVLRGFYALELNRTVFFIQVAIAATNIVLAVLLVGRTSAEHTAPALVAAYVGSYAVGAAASYTILARRVGGLRTRVLVRFLVRLGIAALVGGAAAYAVMTGLSAVSPDRPSWIAAAGSGVLIGLVDLAVVLAVARLLRITELTDVMESVSKRLGKSVRQPG